MPWWVKDHPPPHRWGRQAAGLLSPLQLPKDKKNKPLSRWQVWPEASNPESLGLEFGKDYGVVTCSRCDGDARIRRIQCFCRGERDLVVRAERGCGEKDCNSGRVPISKAQEQELG